jgi:hypothetical protein
MHTTFNLITALQQGFFNLPNQYINLVGNHLDNVTIYLGNRIQPIFGSLYTQNPVNIPRVYGGNALVQYLQETFVDGNVPNVSIINPTTFWVYP